jgi:hypothetical protein
MYEFPPRISLYSDRILHTSSKILAERGEDGIDGGITYWNPIMA